MLTQNEIEKEKRIKNKDIPILFSNVNWLISMCSMDFK